MPRVRPADGTGRRRSVNNGWSDLFLGVIAAATLIMALVQVGAMIAGAAAARQAQQAIQSVHQEVQPLSARAQSIAEEASRTVALATAQAQKVDRLITDLSQRVDETATVLQEAIITPAREGLAIVAAVKATLAGASGRPGAAARETVATPKRKIRCSSGESASLRARSRSCYKVGTTSIKVRSTMLLFGRPSIVSLVASCCVLPGCRFPDRFGRAIRSPLPPPKSSSSTRRGKTRGDCDARSRHARGVRRRALHLPGRSCSSSRRNIRPRQLLVDRITAKDYQAVYVDLQSASVRGSKVFMHGSGRRWPGRETRRRPGGR